MRVDSHIHFWRYDSQEYPWISADMQGLKRDLLPEDVRPLLDAAGIDSCIAVQARVAERETDFLLDLAGQYPWVAGVIGWVDLSSDSLAQRLASWASNRKLMGFRHILQGDPNAGELVDSAAFRRGVALLQSRQMIYELLIFADQLPAVTDFSRRSDQHWLVLDHLGKPNIRNRRLDSWRRDLAPIAALPHVVCKLSGLVTEANDASGKFDAAHLRDYLDVALEMFGPQRLLFGSDWPVCLLVASYAEAADIVERWSAQLSASDREWIWGSTAARIYGLTPAEISSSGDA
ncbi:amidohydrolase family protein [Steroidobacter sp.]|uniref:amidohydrolase family protein n=1 Tax=Steroidobacter sp. TaxID=1978227 RepID=UPI001A4A18EF|nr:amidohydrolase family protein [Steroidobacter sp.]MBL8268783.1 amidohydrolase family protein [Steroidobacter sp.]